MSSIKDDLFPDSRILIQTAIFIVTLAAAHFYLIKPALRLTMERKKRTSGASDVAKSEVMRGDALEAKYNTEFRAKLEEAKALRVSEVAAGQKEAESIIADSQTQMARQVADTKASLERSVSEERSKIPATVNQIVESMLRSLGVSSAVLFFASVFLSVQEVALAAGGHGNVDVMTGIVWPFVQFFCYLFIIVFFGRKIVGGILESRRDNLRTKLSEAKQALTLAQRKTTEFEAKLAALQGEIETMRAQYVQDGKREREKIIADAMALKAQMAKDAERAAQEIVTRGCEELRKEVVEQALKTVEAKLTPEVTKNLNKRLNAEAFDGIQKLATH